MLNPAHTLVINWDEDGNIEYRDLTTGKEGQVAAGDEVVLKGEGGRAIAIYNAPVPDEDGAEEGLRP